MVFSNKASLALREGRFSSEDLICSIINEVVVKKERDETGIARYKYTIIGPALDGCMLYCCGKIIEHEGSKYFFIITFHEGR